MTDRHTHTPPSLVFCNSAHSLHVYLSIPIIQTSVLPAPNSSKSLKIILKWCPAPTEKITGELLPDLGRVKTTAFVCSLPFVFSPSERSESVTRYITVKILCTISISNHVLAVVRYLTESRKRICNITCSIGQPTHTYGFFPLKFSLPS